MAAAMEIPHNDEAKVSERTRLAPGNMVQLLCSKIRILCTIVRLQASLKSYNHECTDKKTSKPPLAVRSKVAELKVAQSRKISYQYYGTPNGVQSNTTLKQEMKIRKVIPKWLLDMIRIDPEQRTEKEISKIRQHLEQRKGDFFHKFGLKEKDIFCKHCKHIWYDKKRVIVKTGHRGELMYYIYSGNVSVSIEQDSQDTYDRSPTAQLHAAQIFGEISLIYNLPRSGTIVCEQDVELLYVDKDVAKDIFLKDDMKEKLQLIQKCDLFSGWKKEDLIQICQMSKIVNYPLGCKIDGCTIKSQFVYLVLQGRVEIMKYVTTERVAGTNDEDMTHYLPKLKNPDPSLLNRTYRSKILTGLLSMDFIGPYSTVHLQCLFGDKEDVDRGMMIISRGVKVMRLPKFHLRSLVSQLQWNSMRHKSLEATKYPSLQTLQRIYMEKVQWLQYRSVVYRDLLQEKLGLPMSAKPASAKGSSGWAKFPGYKQQGKPKEKKSPFVDCLSSKEPIHLHRRDSHRESCLRMVPNNRLGKYFQQPSIT